MAKAAHRTTPYGSKSVVLLMLFNESTRRGWTYPQIAAAAGVERNTVPSWWRGDRMPSVYYLERWAKALGGYLHFTIPADIELPAPPAVPAAPKGADLRGQRRRA